MNGQLKYQQLIELLEKSNYLNFIQTSFNTKAAKIRDLEIPPSPKDIYFQNNPEWYLAITAQTMTRENIIYPIEKKISFSNSITMIPSRVNVLFQSVDGRFHTTKQHRHISLRWESHHCDRLTKILFHLNRLRVVRKR
mgnify:CR=1 FL=1